LREIWNALFYIVKTGCQWRMLPAHFPKWQLVYYYYRKWSEQTEFDLLLNDLRESVRFKRGQNKQASAGIMDSQSVRWGNNRSLNGIDGNKKVKGIKRHVVVDRNGFLIAVMVTAANIHDGKAACLLMRILKELCSSVKVILTDGGYRGEMIETVKKTFNYIIQVVVSKYKEHGFRPIHKRWIVERTLSWFDNYRRRCRNYELTFDSAEEMVKIASIRLLLNKI
jgi:putative transposase